MTQIQELSRALKILSPISGLSWIYKDRDNPEDCLNGKTKGEKF